MRGNHDTIIRELSHLAEFSGDEAVAFSGSVSEEEIRLAEEELGVEFPIGYRVFLSHLGSGTVSYYKILGLGGETLWSDVVAMNQLAIPRRPQHLLKFAEAGQFTFYFDMSKRDHSGACPVVVFGPGIHKQRIAPSFADFLRMATQGLQRLWTPVPQHDQFELL